MSMLSQPLDKALLQSDKLEFAGFQSFLECEKIDFKYKENSSFVLQDFNFQLIKGQKVGIIGRTGSGKSTAVDIIMGLLPPTNGRMLVDGVDIYDPENVEFLRKWRACVAHVPQNIYLADSSLKENIAFGIPCKDIDLDRVKLVSQKAQISSLIDDLDDGYSTFVGERGVRLSGGQKQRIAIARAFYKNADVLVFDEATSALDNATEDSVMATINRLKSNCTVLLVAHRLSTLRDCDRVIEIESGKVVADKPPQQIF